MFYQGSTPAIVIDVDADLTGCECATLAITDGRSTITIAREQMAITENSITVALTQQQTLRLSGRITLQLKYKQGGNVFVSDPVTDDVENVIDRRVM